MLSAFDTIIQKPSCFTSFSYNFPATPPPTFDYRRGEAALISSAVAEVTGAEPRSFKSFFRDYAGLFRRAN